MKHTDMLRAIEDAAAEVGWPLAWNDAIRLATHLAMVLERNRFVNLTAVADPVEAVRLHVADSLAAASVVAEAPPGPLLDIGSGAGYPAIPLAVATGRGTTMLESVGKKAAFLTEVVAEIELDAVVAAERAERWAVDHGDSYAVVTARAVASLPSLIELAAPLLCPNGWLIALKGQTDRTELSRGCRVAAAIGMSRPRVVGLNVPGVERRSAVVVTRQGDLARSLPRAVGRAQARPLA